MSQVIGRTYFSHKEQLNSPGLTSHYIGLTLRQLSFETVQQLKQTICAMANTEGGGILLGVSEKEPHCVTGIHMTQSEKEAVKKMLNKICESFYPIIKISKQEALMTFVPVVDEKMQHKQGMYVVKITVKRLHKFFYSYAHPRNPKLNYFCIRNGKSNEKSTSWEYAYPIIQEKLRERPRPAKDVQCIGEQIFIKPIYMRPRQMQEQTIFQQMEKSYKYLLANDPSIEQQPLEQKPIEAKGGIVQQVKYVEKTKNQSKESSARLDRTIAYQHSKKKQQLNETMVKGKVPHVQLLPTIYQQEQKSTTTNQSISNKSTDDQSAVLVLKGFKPNCKHVEKVFKSLKNTMEQMKIQSSLTYRTESGQIQFVFKNEEAKTSTESMLKGTLSGISKFLGYNVTMN